MCLQLRLSTWFVDIHEHTQFSHHEYNLISARSELQSISYLEAGEEQFLYIEYIFELERRSTYATHLFIAPTVVVSLITPIIFLLPQESGEKITFGLLFISYM